MLFSFVLTVFFLILATIVRDEGVSLADDICNVYLPGNIFIDNSTRISFSKTPALTIEYRWSQCLLGSKLHTQTKQAQLAVAHGSHSLLATAPEHQLCRFQMSWTFSTTLLCLVDKTSTVAAPENAFSVFSAFALRRPRAWAIGSTSMNPDAIATDVFRMRRWWLATVRTRTLLSGEKITIIALAGFRRDDNTAWWIIRVYASALCCRYFFVYPEDDVVTSLKMGESVL